MAKPQIERRTEPPFSSEACQARHRSRRTPAEYRRRDSLPTRRRLRAAATPGSAARWRSHARAPTWPSRAASAGSATDTKAVGPKCLVLEGDLTKPDSVEVTIGMTSSNTVSAHLTVARGRGRTRGAAIIATASPAQGIVCMRRPQKRLDPPQRAPTTAGGASAFKRDMGRRRCELLDDPKSRRHAKARVTGKTERRRLFRGEDADQAPAQPEELAPAYVFFASDADSLHHRRVRRHRRWSGAVEVVFSDAYHLRRRPRSAALSPRIHRNTATMSLSQSM